MLYFLSSLNMFAYNAKNKMLASCKYKRNSLYNMLFVKQHLPHFHSFDRNSAFNHLAYQVKASFSS